MWKSCKFGLFYILSNISVEPATFLRGLSDNLVASVWNSLKIDKVCREGTQWFGDGTTANIKY